MDNDAFRDLVRKRSSPSSSKQFARKAVEDDYKRKRKRGRPNRGGDSGSGSDSSSEEEDDRKRSKRLADSKKKKRKKDDDSDDDEEDATPKYRDRAKERREGIMGGMPGDAEQKAQSSSVKDQQQFFPRKYASNESTSNKKQRIQLSNSNNTNNKSEPAAMKKRKAETPEEKQLRQLLQIIREKVQTRESKDHIAFSNFIREEDDDDVYFSYRNDKDKDDDDDNSSEGNAKEDTRLMTAEDAIANLQTYRLGDITGKTMEQQQYLDQLLEQCAADHIAPPSPALDARSALLRPLSVAASNIQRSILRFALHGLPHDRKRAWETPLEINDYVDHCQPATPCSMAIIERLQSSMDSFKLRQQRERQIAASEAAAAKKAAAEVAAAKSKKKKSKSTSTGSSSQSSVDDDSDDDDIFGDVDGDYVPPDAELEEQSSSGKNKSASTSIFSNLLGRKTQQDDNENNDKPDAIGNFVNSLMKRQSAKSRNDKASMHTSQATEYGGMDIDASSDEESKSKKKKKKKKKGGGSDSDDESRGGGGGGDSDGGKDVDIDSD